MRHNYTQEGFTLIEVVIALGILSIGILSAMIMQISGIKGNATANTITIESNWASDRIEKLIALDYEHDDLKDNGVAGLDHTTAANADGNAVSPDGDYTIFWNVADYLTPYPAPSTNSTVKAIKVIVQRNNPAIKNVVELIYYKQKIF